MAAERLHGDDTTVPLLARGKTATARLWVYVRDDRPFAGGAPPAALFRFSRDRRGEHPQAHLAQWSGILQADAYGGFGELYAADRKPEPITEALCWAHARRKFFELADIAANGRRGKDAPPISPLALEAMKRIDAVFDLERAINGADADHRLAVRQAEAAPLVAELHQWMRAERERLSRHAPVGKAMNYILSRWPSFTRFLEDGRICLTNNAAERALRGAALGRKAWLFAGSERGGDRVTGPRSPPRPKRPERGPPRRVTFGVTMTLFFGLILVVAFRPELLATPIGPGRDTSIGWPIGAALIVFSPGF